MVKKSLVGQWSLCDADGKNSCNAQVPGCNYLDLMKANIIPDPFYGTNEKDCYWVAEKDWLYCKSFNLTEKDLENEKIYLYCQRLDTLCIIYVNGNEAARTENCHISYRFDIKKYLTEGENEIKLYFSSPVNYVKESYEREKTPMNSNGQNGIVVIRKPQCHFGWDWGPVLPPSGIGGEICLEFVSGGEIKALDLRQRRNPDGSFTVSVNTDCIIAEGESLTLTLLHPDGKKETVKGEKGEFVVTNPELWWTNDLSEKEEQPLYTVTATLKKGRKVLQSEKKKIGLREIRLNREKDKYGENFQFILNGVPLFIKGANYIPADSFITRFDSKKLNYLIDSVLYAKMNLIRIWGGGYYESDEFYDLCDRKGILLWQDFCFACQAYPFFNEAFLENVKAEVEFNVKRLKSHPSLALWCGNNEIETMSMGWINFPKYIKWTEKFFYDILPAWVSDLDGDTPFISGSPTGNGYMKNTDSDNIGDTHLWAVWHGLQNMKYYRKRMTRFCSEFGFESLPDIKTVKTFAEEKDYDIHSPVFSSHQKCSSGNDKMLYYIASRFVLPKKFEDLIYLSQVTQLECISDATEHWRRNKGRCNGSVYWQLNDCWSVCSWAGLDYYGNYKALHYRAKHFNAPVSVSIDDSDGKIKLYILNDKNEAQKVSLKCKIFDFNEGVKQEKTREFTVDALENKECFTLFEKQLKAHFDLKKLGIKAELYQNGKLINEKTYLFLPEKKLGLTAPKFSLTAKEVDGKIEVTVSSDRFARLVRIESDKVTLPFSENYFDILPGESKKVTLALPENENADAVIKGLSLMCANVIERSGTDFDDAKIRAKVFFKPENMAQYFYYSTKV
ncbi:MAG: glycosyl hydrolase 2 galactose-binding domain-containing protein [Acutalibacteraceae bacterium]